MLLRTAMILLTAGSPVWAACGPAQDTYLTCRIENSSSVVQVCFDETTVIFDLGPPGKPGLSLREQIQTVDYTPWSGAGMSVWEEIRFFDADHSYIIRAGGERGAEEDKQTGPVVYAGVIVEQGGAEVSSLSCDADSLLHNWGSDGLFAAKSAIGLRWDATNQHWE